MKKRLVAGQQKKVSEMPAPEENLRTARSQMSVNIEEIAMVDSISKVRIPHMIYKQLK